MLAFGLKQLMSHVHRANEVFVYPTPSDLDWRLASDTTFAALHSWHDTCCRTAHALPQRQAAPAVKPAAASGKAAAAQPAQRTAAPPPQPLNLGAAAQPPAQPQVKGRGSEAAPAAGRQPAEDSVFDVAEQARKECGQRPANAPATQQPPGPAAGVPAATAQQPKPAAAARAISVSSDDASQEEVKF